MSRRCAWILKDFDCYDFIYFVNATHTHLLLDLFQVIARFWLEMVIYLRSP